MSENTKINALLIRGTDNVATCVTAVRRGETVACRADGAVLTLTALEDIPQWHKVSLTDLSAGDPVIKYGQMIGKAVRPIPKGSLADHNNITGIPRDYESELLFPDHPDSGQPAGQ